MDKTYFDSSHRFGRIGALIGVAFMLGIPAIICTVYGIWPKDIMQIVTVSSGLLAIFIPTNISEVLSFSPALGSASYIAFLTGNVTNLKLPCALNAMAQSEVDQGTEEGDIISSIAIGSSSVVTTLIIILGVLLLVPLQPVLTSAPVQTATTYMLPALFGSLIVGVLNEDCGEYVAKGKLKAVILPFILIFGINFIYPLSGKEGFGIIASMIITEFCAWLLYKKGKIVLVPKKAVKAKQENAET